MPGVVPPPQVNLSPAAQQALAAIGAAQATVMQLIATNDYVLATIGLPASGTSPATGAAMLLAVMNGLLADGQLRILNARLARMAYNLQVA